MDEETFQRYDTEFQSLLAQIETSLQEDPPSAYSDNLFQQADDLVKQMALEARSVSESTLKRELLQKVRNLKSQLAKLQQERQSQDLFSDGRDGLLRQTEDMLATQNDTLERARRTMQETETVALEITEELGNNREKLMSAHGRVREVSGMTGRARKILSAMSQRAVQQKMVMYGVSIALMIGFLILLFSIFYG